MPLIEGENVGAVVTIREHDDGGVSQAKVKACVLSNDIACRANVLVAELGKAVNGPCNLTQESELRVLPNTPGQEIVQFGENKR